MKKLPLHPAIRKHKENLTFNEKIALYVNDKVGTMWFAYFCFVLVSIPLVFPGIMPVVQYISSGYLQLLLLPLIVVASNISSRKSDARSAFDYLVDRRAERKIEELQRSIARIENEKLDEILKIISSWQESLDNESKA